MVEHHSTRYELLSVPNRQPSKYFFKTLLADQLPISPDNLLFETSIIRMFIKFPSSAGRVRVGELSETLRIMVRAGTNNLLVGLLNERSKICNGQFPCLGGIG